ncbi:hypothetical protein COLO4_08548 [Corchorus olitorius]|uniref:Protein kinase domain-containing protein n=1 Tax=Corchorus olitorius TaxID=93759 RepID=A0A1R3KFC1_9ROSI|nr:hypothetical protein COLO4_08548 [Corchorus olitorius]
MECEEKSKDNNITGGFLCNGVKQSCQSYVTFRAELPYDLAVTIAYLLGAQPNLISSFRLNNVSSDVSLIPCKFLEPTIIAPPQAPAPPPPSQISIAPVRNSKSSHKWVFVGIGVATGLLLLFGLLGLHFCSYRHSSLKATLEAPATPKPKPLSDSIAYSHKSWFVSIQGGRYPVESLSTYKFKDLEAATGNFSESNIIKGSVSRGQFQGDAAAVKVMKGDVSAEINLLKKINHNNIVRLLAAEKNDKGEELLSESTKRVLEGVNVREKLQNLIDPTLRSEYPLGFGFLLAQLAKTCVAYHLNA